MQTKTKQATIVLSIVTAVILLAAPLEARHQAHAQILICQSTDACDVNHATGNPHPTAIPPDPNPGTAEKGNPHNSQSCTGKPQGEIGSDTCHGSQ